MNFFLGRNSLVMPKYGMVDYDIAEIAALEAVFSDIKMHLCDFHRRQSWSR